MGISTINDATAQFIVNVPMEEEDRVRDLVRSLDGEMYWVSVDPNPEYDNEWQLADFGAFDSVVTTMRDFILDLAGDDQDGESEDRDEDVEEGEEEDEVRGPDTGWLDRLDKYGQRALVSWAVRRWNYCGHNGIESDAFGPDFRAGLFRIVAPVLPFERVAYDQSEIDLRLYRVGPEADALVYVEPGGYRKVEPAEARELAKRLASNPEADPSVAERLRSAVDTMV